MKILQPEELPPLLALKKGRSTKLRVLLLSLEVGQGLFMAKDEWKTKHGPYYIVARIKKTHGFLYQYTKKADDTGWIFVRTA